MPYTLALLASISITAFLVTLYRLPNEFSRPFKPGPRMLTAGIWTLHFGFDNEGRDSQRGVRDLIKCVDIIQSFVFSEDSSVIKQKVICSSTLWDYWKRIYM
jgi:hypothetical protein